MKTQVTLQVTPITGGITITALDYTLNFYDVWRLKIQLQRFRNIWHVKRTGDSRLTAYALGSQHKKLAAQVGQQLRLYASTDVQLYIARINQVEPRELLLGVVFDKTLVPPDLNPFVKQLISTLKPIDHMTVTLKKVGQRYFVIKVVAPLWVIPCWRDQFAEAHLYVTVKKYLQEVPPARFFQHMTTYFS